MAASGLLVGYTRLTFSIVVIMLETAQSVDLFMPVMIVVIISVWVGEIFTRSLYVNAIFGKNIPFLTGEIPDECTELRASDVMHRPVQVLSYRETALSIYTALKETPHNGYPIVDQAQKVIGLITRNALIILLKKQAFKRGGDDGGNRGVGGINSSINDEDDIRATTTVEGRYTTIR